MRATIYLKNLNGWDAVVIEKHKSGSLYYLYSFYQNSINKENYNSITN